jgi:hypothetical protein
VECIDELIGRGRLGNGDWRGVEEVTLQVKTPIQYDIEEWRREEK